MLAMNISTHIINFGRKQCLLLILILNQLNTYSPFLSKHLVRKQTLTNQLKVINNTIESHQSLFCEQQQKIKHIQQRVLPKLTKISDQYGSDSMIRIKNKQIREQPSNSF